MRSILTVMVLAATAMALPACGDDNSNNGDANTNVPADLSVTPASPDMQLLSRCGHPGDVGNSLGVGKFCTNQGPDCSGNGMANLCSALVNGQTPSADDSYFCSFTCSSSDPPGTCGDNATCLCNASSQCACIPTSCIPPGDGGP